MDRLTDRQTDTPCIEAFFVLATMAYFGQFCTNLGWFLQILGNFEKKKIPETDGQIDGQTDRYTMHWGLFCVGHYGLFWPILYKFRLIFANFGQFWEENIPETDRQTEEQTDRHTMHCGLFCVGHYGLFWPILYQFRLFLPILGNFEKKKKFQRQMDRQTDRRTDIPRIEAYFVLATMAYFGKLCTNLGWFLPILAILRRRKNSRDRRTDRRTDGQTYHALRPLPSGHGLKKIWTPFFL